MAMKDSEFQNGLIILDEPNAVYYSGQIIRGKVNFELNNPLKILHLSVIYKGEANVLWTEEEHEMYSGVKRNKLVKYVGHEEYFNITQCLCGGKGVSVLPTGAHSFPFQYQIPFTAPSSFKGEKGEVAYSVTAFMLLKDGVTKEEIVKKFNVIAPYDLNAEEFKRPISMEFEEVYSCNCACAARPLCVSVRVPRNAHALGHSVPIALRARNDASVEVTQIIFEVIKRMRYLSQEPMSTVEPPEEVIASMKKGPILSKTNREYVFELKLPDLIALNLDNCGIMDVGYFFKVTIKVSGCNDDMSDEAEMHVGMIPMSSDFDVKAVSSLTECLPNGPIPNPNMPMSYSNAFTQNPNIQICPPGPSPIPYPVVANVVDGNMYGSKNNLAGAFETNVKVQVNQNPISMPMPAYPAQGQSGYPSFSQISQNPISMPIPAYPLPQGQSGYSYYPPQGQSRPYPNDLESPPPPYSIATAPSAPPPS